MSNRLDFRKVAPEALKTILNIETYLARSGVEHSLLHLIRMRASQINGCAFCLDMHSKSRAPAKTAVEA